MRAAIKTERLTKTYKGKKGKPIHAINNLNLEINEGTTFGFIGPNGAGKTTTIKIIIGLIFPTSGKASVFNRSVSEPAARNSIGYLSEVASYSPVMEAFELLITFGALAGMTAVDAEKKATELLTLVGLYERRKSRLGEFSKGMLQRFGIAQALLNNPSLLILDEPTSGLDPIGQREVLDVLHSLKRKGITIFFSSHRLVEVEGLCDIIGIINLGDLIFYGTLPELEAKETKTPFVIRFESQEKKNFQIANKQSQLLQGNLHEVTVGQMELNQALNDAHNLGLNISSILPRRAPLEDVFIEMINQHQKEMTRA